MYWYLKKLKSVCGKNNFQKKNKTNFFKLLVLEREIKIYIYIYQRIVHTWVSDRRLENWDGVIRQIVRNDEAALLVDRFGGVHASQETQNIAVQPTPVLLHELDEVPLWWFWEETHAGAEWILFTAPSIVWWELAGWVSSLVLFVLDRWEIL